MENSKKVTEEMTTSLSTLMHAMDPTQHQKTMDILVELGTESALDYALQVDTACKKIQEISNNMNTLNYKGKLSTFFLKYEKSTNLLVRQMSFFISKLEDDECAGS